MACRRAGQATDAIQRRAQLLQVVHRGSERTCQNTLGPGRYQVQGQLLRFVLPQVLVDHHDIGYSH